MSKALVSIVIIVIGVTACTAGGDEDTATITPPPTEAPAPPPTVDNTFWADGLNEGICRDIGACDGTTQDAQDLIDAACESLILNGWDLDATIEQWAAWTWDNNVPEVEAMIGAYSFGFVHGDRSLCND